MFINMMHPLTTRANKSYYIIMCDDTTFKNVPIFNTKNRETNPLCN